MKKRAISKHLSGPKVVARFMLGGKTVCEIIEDRSSIGGFSVKLGPGHYMVIPQTSVDEILQYGISCGYEAKAVL